VAHRDHAYEDTPAEWHKQCRGGLRLRTEEPGKTTIKSRIRNWRTRVDGKFRFSVNGCGGWVIFTHVSSGQNLKKVLTLR
jgi:hypothetical protein